MAPRQNTFTLVPNPMGVQGLMSRPETGVMSKPPMTSKQAKKLYQQATRGPRLTKAEQRRLELAEQERIRKELEKDKQVNKARIAREKKKTKEQQAMNDRRKKGLPLVDVRPSQDTLSRFIRGNGFGKKRDSDEAKVQPETPECDGQSATECEKENQPPQKRPRTSQRASQREIEVTGSREKLDDIPEVLSTPPPVPEPEEAPEIERICDTPPPRSQPSHADCERDIQVGTIPGDGSPVTKITQHARPASRSDNEKSQLGQQSKRSKPQTGDHIAGSTSSKPTELLKSLPADAHSLQGSPLNANPVTLNQQRSIEAQPPAGTIVDNTGEKEKPRISQRVPTEGARPEEARDITPKPQIGRNVGRLGQKQAQHTARPKPSGGLPTPAPSSQLSSTSSRSVAKPQTKPQQPAKPAAEMPKFQAPAPPPSLSAVPKAPLKTPAVPTSARPPTLQHTAPIPSAYRSARPPILRNSPATPPVFRATSVAKPANAVTKSAGPKTTLQTPKFLPKHPNMADAGSSAHQYRVTRNGRQQAPSNEPPTSTQLFLATHIDDVLPTPSQEARELLEDIEKEPLVRKPPFKRPPVPSFNKPPAPKTTSRPAQSTTLPPTQKQELDAMLPFISTQDLILSSQDIRDLEQGTETPSRAMEPCETVRLASLTQKQLNSSFPPAAKRGWAPRKPMQRGKGSEPGPPPFKRPHSSSSAQGLSLGRSTPVPRASPAFTPPGHVSQTSMGPSGNAMQTSMRSSGNVLQASIRPPCDNSLPAVATPEVNTSARSSQEKPRFFTSSGLGPEYLLALDRSKKTFEEEEERRRNELQQEEQRREELQREEHRREPRREGRRQLEQREAARSGRTQTLRGSFTNQQTSQTRATEECATQLSRLVEANRSKFELAPSQETDYGDFDLEAFDLLEGVLVRNNEA